MSEITEMEKSTECEMEYCIECEMEKKKTEMGNYLTIECFYRLCDECKDKTLIYMDEVDMYYVKRTFITSAFNDDFNYREANCKYGLHPKEHLRPKISKKDMVRLLYHYNIKIKNIGKIKKYELREYIELLQETYL
jgi:hypothetical protein